MDRSLLLIRFLSRLEPSAVKVARWVLRRQDQGNLALLPDGWGMSTSPTVNLAEFDNMVLFYSAVRATGENNAWKIDKKQTG
jgi:hypothetical protein